MKRYVVDRERLESMYPTMDERFERNMRAMIDTLPARREKRHVMMKPRYAVAFALLMVVLLALILLRPPGDRGWRSPLLLGWMGIAAGSGLLFLGVGRVSSALEVFFTLSTAFLARSLWLSRHP